MSLDSECLFCKIIKGDIPCKKILETEKSLAFLDIFPLSEGHALVIPKHHGSSLHDIPDDVLQDNIVQVKKIAATVDGHYNLLQNNGSSAHQEVMHVHFHIIPKPNAEKGLGISWPSSKAEDSDLDKSLEEIKKKI